MKEKFITDGTIDWNKFTHSLGRTREYYVTKFFEDFVEEYVSSGLPKAQAQLFCVNMKPTPYEKNIMTSIGYELITSGG